MMTRIRTLRPTYAEINLKNFAYNVEQAKKLSGSEIIAIVKADGYGHGAIQLADYAYNNCGVERFGVATVKEAIDLREALGQRPAIYILGYVSSDFYPEILENRITLTVFDHAGAKEYNDFLEKVGIGAGVSIKIDTGMGRLGFDMSLSLNEFHEKYPKLKAVHIMSHLASSDTEPEYTNTQIERFDKWISQNSWEGDSSLYNSAGLANYSNKYTFTRPGLLMYGYVYGENSVDLKKVMSIYSKVVQVKRLRKGESVSYNRKFTAEKDMTIGVVPIGYADGYPRCFTNKANMLVDGVLCPVVGTVCMDMTMIDLTDVDTTGELKVEVLGENISASYWAEIANTISYEILCGISYRIPRVYID